MPEIGFPGRTLVGSWANSGNTPPSTPGAKSYDPALTQNLVLCHPAHAQVHRLLGCSAIKANPS